MPERPYEIEIFAPDGTALWRASDGESFEATSVTSGEQARLLQRQVAPDPNYVPPVKRSQVLDEAERLGFISRAGCVRGFLAILPPATVFDSCLETFNQRSLAAKDAVRIDFPSVFDNLPLDMTKLTQGYERQGRMFPIAPQEAGLRLSYAADPGLFAWLRGRSLAPERLPYAVYTPIEGFRRFQTGEIAGIDVVRQYKIPDLHIIATRADAEEAYVDHITESAKDLRFFFAENVVLFHEIVADIADEHRLLGASSASTAGLFTVVRYVTKRTRYYGIKSGLIVNAGFADLRLVTLQWDDTNALRFGITVGDAVPVIIHATLPAGWPKMLPIILGRGLAGLSAFEFPPEIAPVQVSCLPIAERHVPQAQALAERLSRDGVRCELRSDIERPLKVRLGAAKADWRPFVSVIGDRETEENTAMIQSLSSRETWSTETFLNRFTERFHRCQPQPGLLNAALPY